jgi:hypothetical protein
LIKTKVSQSDYDTNNKKIDTHFSAVEQTAKGISSSVTDVSNKVNANKTSTDKAISDTNDKVANIQVGGTNLILYSEVSNFGSDSFVYDSTNHIWTIDIPAAYSNWGYGFYFYAGSRTAINPGEYLTYSCEIYSDVAFTLDHDVNNVAIDGNNWSGNDNDDRNLETNSGFGSLLSAGAWHKVWFTIKARTDKTVGIQNSNTNIGALPQSSAYTIKVRHIKIEKGNKATDWSPAPEDVDASISKVDKRVDDVNTLLNNTKSDLQKDIDDNKTDADGKISAQGTKIDQTKSDVTTLAGRVTTTEKGISDNTAAIDVNAKAIKTKVSQTDYDDNNTAIQSKFSEIKQTTDGISLTVSDVSTKVDNIQIGGTNLFVDGQFKNVAEHPKYKHIVTSDGIDALSIINQGDWFLDGGYFKIGIGTNKFKPGDVVTVSFDVYPISGQLSCDIDGMINDVSVPSNLTQNAWSRVTGTQTCINATYINLNLYGTSSAPFTGYVTNFTIRKGNKDLGWSPAPEDVDASISKVDKRVDDVNTNASNAVTTANSANTTANSANSKADTINSGLSATGIDIRSHRITATVDNFTIKNNSGVTTFSVDKDGNLIGTGNASFSGKISSSSGKIGAWSIDSYGLVSATVGMNGGTIKVGDGSYHFLNINDTGELLAVRNDDGTCASFYTSGSSGVGLDILGQTDSIALKVHGNAYLISRSGEYTYINGRAQGVAMISESCTIGDSSCTALINGQMFKPSLVLCSGNDDYTINLPSSPVTGEEYLIRKVSAANIFVSGNGRNIKDCNRGAGGSMRNSVRLQDSQLGYFVYEGSWWVYNEMN